MKLRRFRVDSTQVRGGVALIEGEAAHHIRHVLRLKPGQLVELFDGEGNEWVGQVERVEKRAVQVRIETQHFTAAPLEGPRVVLLLSLARGSHTDLAIQKTTELGVSEIRLFMSERTVAVARPGGDPVRLDRLERIATDAARQSGRAHVPAVRTALPFRDVLDDLEGGELRVMLWEGEHTHAYADVLRAWDTSRPLVLLVGPEGGFTEDEVEAARQAGFERVHVGPFILRTETAAIAAVAAARILAPAPGAPIAVVPEDQLDEPEEPDDSPEPLDDEGG